ncbi:phage tail protein [Rhizobium tumorigenes]|uniref:phage tail-collar fiber domain-containing protein n=1 Tax=Rhizobium tumorigenes TaxID=2041385 RepID=UPI00241EA3F2|nr:phage tail protein [Rhizobium tumorigenes]WFS02771.1 phage tail protein [Rhizobium tumorigenes]
MSYTAIPTLLGQAALAAALAGCDTIVITQMVIGDGNGNVTTPLETQTVLVHQVASVPISASTRVNNMVTFDGFIDRDTGGWTIREAGLVNAAGQLLFVASIPATEKLTMAQNALDELTLGLRVVVSETASITLQPPAASLVSIFNMIRAPWITVDSATTTTPPASPAADNCYLVPAGATGAWVGNVNRLAQWNGNAWVFKIVPATHLVGVSDTGKYLRRTSTGWTEFFLPSGPASRGRWAGRML